MGPASITPGLAVLGEAYAAADPNPTLYESYIIRTYGQLPAVRQGGTAIPGECWDKQHKGKGLRASGSEAIKGVRHEGAH